MSRGVPPRRVAAHFLFAGRAANDRGEANEERLLEAVLWLRDTGAAPWVVDARRAPELDGRGIDLLVEADCGSLYLQSKSSHTGAAMFRSEERVGVVVVSLYDETTRARALSALRILRDEELARRAAQKTQMGMQTPGVPPKVPEDPTLLVRAMNLLALRAAGKPLKMRQAGELADLFGRTPNRRDAALWKKYLKTRK